MAEKKYNLLDFFDLNKEFKMAEVKPMPKPQFSIFDDQCQAPRLEERKRVRGRKQEYVEAFKKKQEEEFERHLDPDYKPEASELGFNLNTGMSTMEKDSIYDGTIRGVSSMAIKSNEIMNNYSIKEPQECQENRDLPILNDAEDIIDEINANTVTIISGATGCGKTTMIPRFILNYHKERRLDVKIIVTQPRRIAAQSVARRVAEGMGVKLGTLVGYKVGLDKANVSPDTLLMYCTTGILKKMLIGKRCLTEWTHVILDEVHDREEDMDFLMLLCKRFVNTNSRGVKLILMSATLNIDKLKRYFSWKMTGNRLIYAAQHEVKVLSLYEISEFYLEQLSPDSLHKEANVNSDDLKLNEADPNVSDGMIRVCHYIITHFSSLEEGHRNPGAVLVFLPGEAEIGRVKNYLEKNARGKKWWVLPLHSRIPVEDTQLIFGSKSGYRKIILSTNIAESSVTIPDIQYVIDFCLTKHQVCDRDTNYVSLKLQWADKNSCTQRRGRCGRTCDGRLYRLVTRRFYDEWCPQSHLPEMLRAPLDKLILDTKLLDFGPPKEILALAMDPPDLESISTTIMHLKEWGALLPTVNKVDVEDDGDLTVLGEVLASIPVDVRLGKLIVYGFIFGVLDEAVIIAAGLTNKSIFTAPFDLKQKAYAHKLFWADKTFSDCLAVLIAYSVWKEKKESRYFNRQAGSKGFEHHWTRTRFLQLKALEDMEKTVEEIKRGLDMNKMIQPLLPNRTDEVLSDEQKMNFLKCAIFGAFYPNYLVRPKGSSMDMREVYKGLGSSPYSTSFYLSGFPPVQSPYGDLYSDQIKRIFADSCDVSRDVIKVSFDGSKIVVRFDITQFETSQTRDEKLAIGSSNLTGDILHHVYVALKLRNLPSNVRREKLTIQIYPEDLAKKIFDAQRAKEAAKKSSDTANRTDASTIGTVNPPLNKVDIQFLDLVYVANPNSIWVNYTEDLEKAEAVADAAMAIIAPGNIEKCRFCQTWQDVRVNSVYLAPFETAYYRARVEKIDIQGKKARVFFIDFGNSESIDIKLLILIDDRIIHQYPAIVDIPGLALECSLANVKPNQLRSEASFGQWDQVSTNAMRHLFPGGGDTDTVFAIVVSVIPQARAPLVNVDMYLDFELTDKINSKFLLMKDRHGKSFADFDHGSNFCLFNHSVSLEIPSLRECHRLNPEEATRSVTLKGPHHPLEAQLYGVHRTGTGKNIKVEQDSVNSVFLDRFPTSTTDQWLVAGRVDLNPSGSTLLARQTTVMPNKPGLGPILVMIFAPRVELRCDAKKTEYTGCLTGLGSREKGWGSGSNQQFSAKAVELKEKVSYFPEHDTELSFDVKLDSDDILAINKVRYHISRLLSRPMKSRDRSGNLLPLVQRREEPPEFTKREVLLKTQRKIRDLLEWLMNQEREAKEQEFFNYSYHWNQLPQEADDLNTFEVQCDADLFLPTFPAIRLLEDKMVSLYNILAVVRSMKELVIQKTNKDEAVECPVCNVHFESGRWTEIETHFETETHTWNYTRHSQTYQKLRKEFKLMTKK